MISEKINERPKVKFSLTRLLRENSRAQGLFLISPANIYLFILVVLPLILVTGLSFLSRGSYGQVEVRLNLTNYTRLFDALYGKVMIFSLGVGVGTTVICILVGYPLAYFLAHAPVKQRSLLLFLILLPFWTNFIIRIFAWMIILRSGGLLDSLLQWLHLTQEPLNLLYTPTAVLIGMVYEFLPFMVLPLYTSLEKIENSLLEAAADLGAPPWKAFLRVTLPLSVPGMIAGTILTFIPAMGMFVVPDILGGAKTILIGNVIRNQFLTARDWPFGAAASMVLMVMTMVLTLYYTRKAGFGEELLI
ncbi:MAG: ABC transporter permease [Anaerolineales bacterium]|jgi:spermidine/putrescine transport system permease protein